MDTLSHTMLTTCIMLYVMSLLFNNLQALSVNFFLVYIVTLTIEPQLVSTLTILLPANVRHSLAVVPLALVWSLT